MTTGFERSMFSASAHVLWKALRLPIVLALLLIEPIVNVVGGLAFVGGVLAAVAFESSTVSARFPFLLVFALSVSFAALVVIYHSLVVLLVRD
jgi:hypothetical protein